jgi:uncharacterized damage-inducible protein DinB
MTFEDLQTLLEYHYWARDRVLDAAAAISPQKYTEDLGSSFPSIRDTLAHTYTAEWIWHARWQGVSPPAPLPFDQFPDVASLRSAWMELERRNRAFLATLGEPGIMRTFDYRTLSGLAGSSPFWQMLQHVVNHASYHRGQVTSMLRQVGAQPGKNMDMITFYRERRA